VAGRDRNPYGGLNVGLVEVTQGPGGVRVNLQLLARTREHPDTLTPVFETGPL